MNYHASDIVLSLLPVIILNGTVIISWIIFAFIYPSRKKSEEVLKRMHPSFLGIFLREWSYWILQPFLMSTKALKLSPNMLTGISMVLGFVSGLYYFKGSFATAGWLLVASGALDMLDGSLARMTNRVTREGAFFDSCADRFSESAVFIGLAMYFALNRTINIVGEQSWAYLLFFTLVAGSGAQLVSYVKARGESVGVTTNMGIMQRAERIAVLGFFSVFYPFFKIILTAYQIDEHLPLVCAIIILAIFSIHTAVSRMIIIYTKIRNQHTNDTHI
ncbi:MAG: CDP-alcohol phosphatidyltransferase family protein [Spirochaetes bacterium]|nr:CDP-alcohol phosphatidyltransferase family protein [Spirochaetota bacterium]